MTAVYNAISLLAAACFIYSKPTTTDIDCIIQTEKISQAGESDANLQRVRLQDFSAIMQSKQSCSAYKFEKEFVIALPGVAKENLNAKDLNIRLELHIKLIEYFSKSIKKVLSDQECKAELQGQENDIEHYLNTYMSVAIVKKLKQRRKELHEGSCKAPLTNISFNPPLPDSYTTYGKEKCNKTCTMQLISILNELSVLYNLLQVSYNRPLGNKLLFSFNKSRLEQIIVYERVLI